jgi:hypothetical protein
MPGLTPNSKGANSDEAKTPWATPAIFQADRAKLNDYDKIYT